nr:anti-sigma F factor [Clostridia bacterium]
MKTDYFKITFSSLSNNEAFARSVVGVYALRLNPSVSEISDIKTAVSEAVTNSIVHGYPDSVGEIVLEGYAEDDVLHINVFDEGVGIENVSAALEPFYTTKGEEERSGMGFTIMKSFMDDVSVLSERGKGTKVYMLKKLGIDAK